MSDQPAADLPEDLTFEEAIQRLEAIVEDLEEDTTSLEETLRVYEEGVALARYCLERLDAAEQRVDELNLDDLL